MLDDGHKRKSLGRGLGALLGDDLGFLDSETPAPKAGEKKIAIADLTPSP